MTRKFWHFIRIYNINIQNIGYVKNHYQSKLLLNNEVDLIAMEDAHTEKNKQLCRKGGIPGCELLGAANNRTYGDAIYVRSAIENASHITATGRYNVTYIV